jgi:hypothetical protein
MQQLAAAARAAPKYSTLLMHMLNRREAVDSSQIEGTHTQFDALLLHEIAVGTRDATADPDADVTLNYLPSAGTVCSKNAVYAATPPPGD